MRRWKLGGRSAKGGFRVATKGGDALAHGAETVKKAGRTRSKGMQFRWVRKAFGALAAAAISAGACAAPAPAPHVAKPAMWKLADADTTIYLFGSFHLLPNGEQWRTPAFEKALAGSDTLV